MISKAPLLYRRAQLPRFNLQRVRHQERHVFDLLGSTPTQSTPALSTTSSFSPMTSRPTTAPVGTQSSFASVGGGPQVKPQSPMGMSTTMSPMSSTSHPNYFSGAPPLASTPFIKRQHHESSCVWLRNICQSIECRTTADVLA